jgi:murein DD-endopeptidase MepM/ murein hydrolase activator NlpD
MSTPTTNYPELYFPAVDTATGAGKWGIKNPSLYPASIGHRHPGADFFAKLGSPIRSVADGLVVFADYEVAHGYGRHVDIRHELLDQFFITRYAHLRAISVTVGQTVPAGYQVGTMGGNTSDPYRGVSGGTHLHFEVILPWKPEHIDYIETYSGFSVDPIEWLVTYLRPRPVAMGVVIEREGVNIRPEKTVMMDRVGTVEYDQELPFSVIEDDLSGNTWGKLSSIRPNRWVAITYAGKPLVRLYPLQQEPSPPLPDNVGDVDIDLLMKESYRRGVNNAILIMQGVLDELRGS